jgi:Glyoxalase/Bleomycin resistance protein/Dioxygenase superfamily
MSRSTDLKFVATNTLIVRDRQRKPEVVASPPRDPKVLSIFLNLRVTDTKSCYELWSSRGVKFITEPKVHATELRRYMRDPDGYLIEVGQTTMTPGRLDLSA